MYVAVDRLISQAGALSLVPGWNGTGAASSKLREGAVPRAAPSICGGSGTWRLHHRPEAAGEARRIARPVLGDWDIAEDAVQGALLVISELVTNAVEHALPPLHLHLHNEPTGRRVWIGITDSGSAACAGQWTTSCAADEHGRGLALVAAMTEAHGTHGTTRWASLAAA